MTSRGTIVVEVGRISAFVNQTRWDVKCFELKRLGKQALKKKRNSNYERETRMGDFYCPGTSVSNISGTMNECNESISL